MREQGIRRLLIISGDMHWCFERAEAFCQWLQGDWVWVGASRLSSAPLISTRAVRKLLGQERLHAVFDATKGVDIDALAVLAGTLKAGSFLLLLVPDWSFWRTMPDQESRSWSEQKYPIPTPYFIDHLQKTLLSDKEIAYWQQGASPQIPLSIKRQKWKAPMGEPTREQQAILDKLRHLKTGIYVF